MTNSFITASIIAKESLFQLRNNVVFLNLVHRDYKKEFVKVGDTISIRKPVKFESNDGAVLVKQSVQEGTTPFVIQNRKHIGWGFLTSDLTLTVADYAERYLNPAGIKLGNDVDVSLAQLYKQLWLSAGTPGTTPASFSALGDLATIMDDNAIPDDGKRRLVFNPAARWSMADALKGVYDNSMPKDFIRRGMLGKIANFMIYGNQNIIRHRCGALVDTGILTDGVSQTSNSTPQANSMLLHMDTFGADTANALRAGDVFTIADVYAVNPVSKQSTGQLMQFTVLADFTPVSGEGDVTIAPAIVTTGPYQNVDSVPADSAPCTFMGSDNAYFAQNMGFHKNALGCVMVPLALPDGCNFKARIQDEGVSIRVLKQFSIIDDEDIIRLDIMWGTKAIYPDLGARQWAA